MGCSARGGQPPAGFFAAEVENSLEEANRQLVWDELHEKDPVAIVSRDLISFDAGIECAVPHVFRTEWNLDAEVAGLDSFFGGFVGVADCLKAGQILTGFLMRRCANR